METVSWFGDTHVTELSESRTKTPDAFLLFHGFPGEPPPAEVEKYRGFPRKCVDVGHAIYQATQLDTFLPHYEGLGESRGEFRFSKSVARSLELSTFIKARGYRKLHIVGNSWGGLVGTNVYGTLEESTRGMLVLISPLTDLESEAKIRQFLPYYVERYPNVFTARGFGLEKAVSDLKTVLSQYNPADVVKTLTLDSKKTFLIHGNQDTEIPVESAQRFRELIRGNYVELASDHSYSQNRTEMVSEVLKFVRAQLK